VECGSRMGCTARMYVGSTKRKSRVTTVQEKAACRNGEIRVLPDTYSSATLRSYPCGILLLRHGSVKIARRFLRQIGMSVLMWKRQRVVVTKMWRLYTTT